MSRQLSLRRAPEGAAIVIDVTGWRIADGGRRPMLAVGFVVCEKLPRQQEAERATMATAAKDPETIVRNFCATWPERNVEKVLAYFTDDALYHNMPLEPVTGKDGIREVLNMFISAEAVEVEMRHVVARGNLVFTERVDRMTLGGKRVVLPCAGVFEIRDGKIAAWRDYFDLATWQRQTA